MSSNARELCNYGAHSKPNFIQAKMLLVYKVLHRFESGTGCPWGKWNHAEFCKCQNKFFSQFWAVLHIIFNHLQQNYLYGTEKQRFTINQIFDHNFRIFSVPQIIISLSSYLFEQSTRAHCYLIENKNFHLCRFFQFEEKFIITPLSIWTHSII